MKYPIECLFCGGLRRITNGKMASYECGTEVVLGEWHQTRACKKALNECLKEKAQTIQIPLELWRVMRAIDWDWLMHNVGPDTNVISKEALVTHQLIELEKQLKELENER